MNRKRLLSLSAQKFASDLARDAFHFAKLRVNGAAAGRGRPNAGNVSRPIPTLFPTIVNSLFAAISPTHLSVQREITPWKQSVLAELITVSQDRNKVTLTMDDLSLALGEHGVNVKKPDYCECQIIQHCHRNVNRARLTSETDL